VVVMEEEEQEEVVVIKDPLTYQRFDPRVS
jgi:hypothetical protein